MKQKPCAPLTKSDRQIVEAINAGCNTTRAIAAYLKLPPGTVYNRLGYIKAKFGTDTLRELIEVVRD